MIGVDGRALTEQRTGIGVWVAEIVTRWVAAGEDVTVFIEKGTAHDLPLHTVAVPGPFHLHAARISRRNGWPYLSGWSFIVPVLLGRRSAVMVHDLVPVLFPRTQVLRTRLAFQLLLGAASRRAGAIIVPTEATKADLLRAHPQARGRVHVVPEASRQWPAAQPLPDGVRPPYVLFVGTLEPRKHAVDLAEAFAAAAPAGWQLVLAGKRGWLAPADHARLDGVLHRADVCELGYVSDAQLAGLLQHASVVAYPSAYEGFGLPVLEAMAAGVPVLSTTTPAVREVAGGAALLVDIDGADPYGAGLRQALRQITGDEALRARLSEAGRRRAADFDWDVAAADVLAIVKGLPAPRR